MRTVIISHISRSATFFEVSMQEISIDFLIKDVLSIQSVGVWAIISRFHETNSVITTQFLHKTFECDDIDNLCSLMANFTALLRVGILKIDKDQKYVYILAIKLLIN